MTDELFLILHKVRGLPAFDIAQKVMIGKEEGWIIPTSGHRAYPCWSEPLDLSRVPELVAVTDIPDHYDTKRDDGAAYVEEARAVLIRRGKIKMSSQPPTFSRRF